MAISLTSTNKKTNLTETLIRKYAETDINQLYRDFNTTIDGLKNKEAEKRLEENGRNLIIVGNRNNTFTRLKEAVINPFNIVLFVIAIITYFTDVIFSDTTNYLTVIIILALVFLSSLVAFIQSEKSNKVAEKLSQMIVNKANIKRDNIFNEIEMENVVVGDIVKLSAGDMIPADVRFISTKDTFIAQAALTGESNPVEKFSDAKIKKISSLTDLANIGFMGSNVISGSATALIVATGNNTYFGSMAKTLSGSRAKTSFEKGVDAVSHLLILFIVTMIPVIIVINGFTKQDWINSVLFAVSIAVGLTPEMLPVIMTSTLAKGALNMSKRKVIVKNLGSIQAFGEMDILCTDKTGTLTEDEIVLEKYINLKGLDDVNVLKQAYLNSSFQTSLKNLIDIAIINRAQKEFTEEYIKHFVRIDEIPFDFTRRRMSVLLKSDFYGTQLFTKGAVEEMLAICEHIEIDKVVSEMNDDYYKQAMKIYEENNNQGLRMMALARKMMPDDCEIVSVEDENNLVLIGFMGFLDPPKESATTAINALKDHGVRTVVLTGDTEGVAINVGSKVGINVESSLTGSQIDEMDDEELQQVIATCDLFSKLSPAQKERVVIAFQKAGHTVGYMGDGINDALPLRQADVGISVDSAVDIAKETADIILLEKDLMVLEEGVIGGRTTFGNIIKYIKMATSGNFGNMFSVVIASIFLPFLPMMPVHILTQNLLCDFAQMGMPFDSVDSDYIKKPRRWNTKSIKNFMFVFGPLSSLFDILCFLVMFYIIKANTTHLAPLFQCGWFVFGTLSQILIIHMIRTAKIPFIHSKPSLPLVFSTFSVIIITLVIAFTNIAETLGMMVLPLIYIPWLAALLITYCLLTQLIKKLYIHRFKEWL